MQKSVHIYCSYAHKDQSLLLDLKSHLFPLQRQDLIDTWSDTNVLPGTSKSKQIDEHLERAQIILLLLSPDYLSSDACYKEMQRAMERHERGEARVIPIILRRVLWKDLPCGRLDALPHTGKPVMAWESLDDAFFDIASGIQGIVEEMLSLEERVDEPKSYTKNMATKPLHNLPQPLNEFLGREKDIARVLHALASRSFIICIEGMGGVGKTALATQTALYSLSEPNKLFEQVVWISAQDRPDQELWFHEVLDTIARELGSPSFMKMPLDQKALDVEALLREKSILVIIDNHETMNDPDLNTWIEKKIPGPSKVMITSRASSWRNAQAIALQGMEDAEAIALIRNHCYRQALHSLAKAPFETLLPLVKVTAGNPKAIELALGHIKRGGLSFEEVVDHLHRASESVNDVFNYLYERSWDKMKPDARYVLMVMPFFVDPVKRSALDVASGLSGFRMKNAIEALVEFMFLDADQEALITSRFYRTHPLTRAFALTKLHQDSEYEEAARQRWSQYYLGIIRHSLTRGRDGDPYWNSLVRSGEAPAIDQEWPNIRQVLEWADQEGQDGVLIDLMLLLTHYMNRHFYYAERLIYAEKAVEAADRVQRRKEAALFRIDTLGWTFIETNVLNKAEVTITEGLRIAQTLDSSTQEAMELIVLAHIFLARVAIQRGKLAEATKLLQAVNAGSCRPEIQFRAKMIAGDVVSREGNVENAIALYEEAHGIGNQYGDEGEDEDLAYRMAIAYLLKGDLVKAEHSFKNLPNVEKYATVTTGSIYTRLEEAHFARARGDNREARRLARKALNELSPAIESHWMLDEIRSFLQELEASNVNKLKKQLRK